MCGKWKLTISVTDLMLRIGAVQHTFTCVHTYPGTHTHIHTHMHTHMHRKQGLGGVLVKPFCGNYFFTEKKSMKANGDLASNSRVGYPG